MATESHTEELKNATDKHITSVCLKLSLMFFSFQGDWNNKVQEANNRG